MDLYSHIKEDELDLVDRLGLAYCRLNSYRWDDYIGEKPEGFDELSNHDSRKPITKSDYVRPILKEIKKTIGEANVSRCWWLFELGRTEEEWKEWYYKENVRYMADRMKFLAEMAEEKKRTERRQERHTKVNFWLAVIALAASAAMPIIRQVLSQMP